MAKQCTHIKEDGNQCGAYALSSGDLCYRHDPAMAERRKQSDARGGRTGAGNGRSKPVSIEKVVGEIVEAPDDDQINLETFDEIRQFCNEMINRVVSSSYTQHLSLDSLREIRQWTVELTKLRALQGGSAKDRIIELEAIAAEVRRKRMEISYKR